MATDEATEVFALTFEDTGTVLVDAYLWRAPETLTSLIAVAPEAIEQETGVNYWDDPEGGARFVRIAIEAPKHQINAREIFRRIAGTERGLRPPLAGEIFFVHPGNGAIFKMYDDRGALLHAPDAELVERLVSRFPHLVLDVQLAPKRPATPKSPGGHDG